MPGGNKKPVFGINRVSVFPCQHTAIPLSSGVPKSLRHPAALCRIPSALVIKAAPKFHTLHHFSPLRIYYILPQYRMQAFFQNLHLIHKSFKKRGAEPQAGFPCLSSFSLFNCLAVQPAWSGAVLSALLSLLSLPGGILSGRRRAGGMASVAGSRHGAMGAVCAAGGFTFFPVPDKPPDNQHHYGSQCRAYQDNRYMPLYPIPHTVSVLSERVSPSIFRPHPGR